MTSPLLAATTEALRAADGMREALLGAAKLLQDCTCQATREPKEARRVVNVAENSVSRFEAAMRAMARIAEELKRKQAQN